MLGTGHVSDPLVELQGSTLDLLRGYLPGPSAGVAQRSPGGPAPPSSPPTANPVALLDFPAHPNAGDHLIYLGQQQYLRRLGYQVGYLADTLRYRPEELRRRVPHGPILLQGGGNLGDRWLPTQEFRERVVRDFPDRPVIQLPQSVDFADPRRAEQAARVFAAHPDLLLLLRDERSLARARLIFPGVRTQFCPDLAVGIGWLDRVADPDHDVVQLLREDNERSGDHQITFPSSVRTLRTDWGFSGWSRLSWTAVRVPGAVATRVPALASALQPLVERSFDQMAWLNVRRAIGVLCRGRGVLTDRLHAAVLAALLGIPVVVLDNSYGKISAAYEAYLRMLPTLTFASSPRVARDQLLEKIASR